MIILLTLISLAYAEEPTAQDNITEARKAQVESHPLVNTQWQKDAINCNLDIAKSLLHVGIPTNPDDEPDTTALQEAIAKCKK